MTRKEYVIKALQHEVTNLLPYHIDFTQQSFENMAAYTKDTEF